MSDPTAEQIAQQLRNEVFWQQFWMHTINGLFTLGMAAIGAFGGYVGYLKLKAGQAENKEGLRQVRTLVDGQMTAKSDQIEQLQGDANRAKDAETDRLREQIKAAAPKTGDQPH
jgi:hypothetical protein